jgi:hypothetical protein
VAGSAVHGESVRLSPTKQRKIVNALAATVAALGFAGVASWSAGPFIAVAAAVSVLCAWLAICAMRQCVILTSSTITVRGWLWSRRVPRDAVTAVTDWPAIRWSSGDRDRWTPVHAFYRPGAGPRMTDHDRENLAYLRAAVRRA